jgi:hypothetical protein
MNSDNTKKTSRFKFFCLLAIIAVLLLIIIYFLEKLCYSILSIVLYFNWLSFLGIIALNLFLVRLIVQAFIFPGGNFIMKKLMRYESGRYPAMYLIRLLEVFKKNIELFKTSCNSTLTPGILRSARSSNF